MPPSMMLFRFKVSKTDTSWVISSKSSARSNTKGRNCSRFTLPVDRMVGKAVEVSVGSNEDWMRP